MCLHIISSSRGIVNEGFIFQSNRCRVVGSMLARVPGYNTGCFWNNAFDINWLVGIFGAFQKQLIKLSTSGIQDQEPSQSTNLLKNLIQCYLYKS